MLTVDAVSDRLRGLGLRDMAAALRRAGCPAQKSAQAQLGWLSSLIDAQQFGRDERHLVRECGWARLPQAAQIGEVRVRPEHGLSKIVWDHLRSCVWIHQREHLVVTGPTGVGKTFLACALGTEAIRRRHRVLYTKVSALLEDWQRAEAANVLADFRRRIARAQLLILDDWAVEPVNNDDLIRLLRLIVDWAAHAAIVVLSPLSVDQWFDRLGDPTMCDQIVDRLTAKAHRVELSGPSLRARVQP